MLKRTPPRRLPPILSASAVAVGIANTFLFLSYHITSLFNPVAAAAASLILPSSSTAALPSFAGTTLLLSGVVTRLATLPLTYRGESAVQRMRLARPPLCHAYRDYRTIAQHPDSIAWEKRVAAQRLRNDRQRIFRSHRISNLSIYTPFLAAMGLQAYVVMAPVQQALLPFLFLATPTTVAASTSGGMLAGIIPVLAGTLSIRNARHHFTVVRHHLGPRSNRVNAHCLTWSQRGYTAAAAAAVACCCSSSATLLMTPPTAAVAVVAASHTCALATVWLGMAMVTRVWQQLTASRHHYYQDHDVSEAEEASDEGEDADLNLDTTATHPFKLSFSGEEEEERREMWDVQKKLLEYECDVRLFRMAKHLWTPAEEMEEEAVKLRQRAEVARGRRLSTAAAPGGGAATSSSGGGDPSSIGPQGSGMTEDEQQELRVAVKAQEWQAELRQRRREDFEKREQQHQPYP